MDAMFPGEREDRRREREQQEREQLASDHIGEREPHFVPVERAWRCSVFNGAMPRQRGTHCFFFIGQARFWLRIP